MDSTTQTLEWGLQPTGEYRAAWGARAILEPYREQRKPRCRGDRRPAMDTFSLLWDRQSATGSEADRNELAARLNTDVLRHVQRLLRADYWGRGGGEDRTYVYAFGDCRVTCGSLPTGRGSPADSPDRGYAGPTPAQGTKD